MLEKKQKYTGQNMIHISCTLKWDILDDMGAYENWTLHNPLPFSSLPLTPILPPLFPLHHQQPLSPNHVCSSVDTTVVDPVSLVLGGWPMSERDTSPARRRRERQLHSFLKHERMTVRITLTEALHHSCGVVPDGKNNALRGPRTASEGGGRPSCETGKRGGVPCLSRRSSQYGQAEGREGVS